MPFGEGSAVQPKPSPPSRLLQTTSVHLHVEFLRRRGGGVGPGHVAVRGHVVVTVRSVPAVGAGTPGQRGLK